MYIYCKSMGSELQHFLVIQEDAVPNAISDCVEKTDCILIF